MVVPCECERMQEDTSIRTSTARDSDEDSFKGLARALSPSSFYRTRFDFASSSSARSNHGRLEPITKSLARSRLFRAACPLCISGWAFISFRSIFWEDLIGNFNFCYIIMCYGVFLQLLLEAERLGGYVCWFIVVCHAHSTYLARGAWSWWMSTASPAFCHPWRCFVTMIANSFIRVQ